MSWPIALLFAVVQGLTEFLPVSSSGHLALLQSALSRLAGEPLPQALAFVVLLPSWIAGGGPPVSTGRGIMMAVSSMGCIVVIAGLVFGMGALVLLFQYRGAFRLAARQSRTAWEQDSSIGRLVHDSC